MPNIDRAGKIIITAALALSGLAMNALPATATSDHFEDKDPSPYCRLVVHAPATAGEFSDRVGTYGFQSTVDGYLDCNGPVYYSAINLQLNYYTYEDSTGTV